MNFRPGQRVRCVNDRGWVCLICGEARRGPAFGQVCVIVEIHEPAPGTSAPEFLTLAGFPPNQGFANCLFRPLEDREMEKLAALAADPPVRARELAEVLP